MIGTAALLLVVGGCGDDDGEDAGAPSSSEAPSVDEEVEAIEGQDPDDIPTCEEQYAEGNVVTAEAVDMGCLDGDGSLWFGGAAELECSDGRVLKWNDRAWWYEGEGVHPHAEDAEELVAPAAEREACEA